MLIARFLTWDNTDCTVHGSVLHSIWRATLLKNDNRDGRAWALLIECLRVGAVFKGFSAGIFGK